MIRRIICKLLGHRLPDDWRHQRDLGLVPIICLRCDLGVAGVHLSHVHRKRVEEARKSVREAQAKLEALLSGGDKS